MLAGGSIRVIFRIIFTTCDVIVTDLVELKRTDLIYSDCVILSLHNECQQHTKMASEERLKEEEKWSNLLEEGRYKLTSTIDPEHFLERLRSERLLNMQDVEKVRNQNLHHTLSMRAGAFLDILQRRGPHTIQRFFYFLQFEYEYLYEQITKKKAESPPEDYTRASGVFDPITHLPDLAIALQKMHKDKKDLTIAFEDLRKKLQSAQKNQQDLEMEVAQLKIYEEDAKRLQNQLERYKEELNNIRGENEICKNRYTQSMEEKVQISRSLHQQLEENNRLIRVNQQLQCELGELRRENYEGTGVYSPPQPPPYDEILHRRHQDDEYLKDTVKKEILQNDLSESREQFEKLHNEYVNVSFQLDKAHEIEQVLLTDNKKLTEEIRRHIKKISFLDNDLETVNTKLNEYLALYKTKSEEYNKLEKENMEERSELRAKEMKLFEEKHALERDYMALKQKYHTEKRESQNLILKFRERSDALSIGSGSTYQDLVGAECKSEDQQSGIERGGVEDEDENTSRFLTYNLSTKVYPSSIKRTEPEKNKPTTAEVDEELESLGPQFKHGMERSVSREESVTSVDDGKNDKLDNDENTAANRTSKILERNVSFSDIDTDVITAADELLDVVLYDRYQEFNEIPVPVPPGKDIIELKGGNLTGIYILKSGGVQDLIVGSQLIKATYIFEGKTETVCFLYKTLEEARLLLEHCRKKELSDLKLYVKKLSEAEEKRKLHPGDYIFIRCNESWQGKAGTKSCHGFEPWKIFLVQNTRLDNNRWEAKQTDRLTGRSSEVNQIPSMNYLQNNKKSWARRDAIKKSPSSEKLGKADPYVKVLPVRSKLKFPVILVGKPAVVRAVKELLKSSKFIIRSYECKSTETRWIEWVREDAHVFFEGSKDIVEKCQGRAIYLNLIAEDIQDLYRKIGLPEETVSGEDGETLVPDFYTECVDVTKCVDRESVLKALVDQIDNAQSKLFWFTRDQVSKEMLNEYKAFLGTTGNTLEELNFSLA